MTLTFCWPRGKSVAHFVDAVGPFRRHLPPLHVSQQANFQLQPAPRTCGADMDLFVRNVRDTR